MGLVSLERIPAVPLAFMNEDHLEEGRLLNELAEALARLGAGAGTPQLVAERLAIFYAHMREHFGREEGAMEQEIFPLFRTHQEEHARVLAQLADESRLFRETGDATELVPFVSLNWPAWSRSHIQSMDLTAARFLCASET